MARASSIDIIILGANGNCVDAAETVDLLSQRGEPLRMLGFLDDDDALLGRQVGGYPVLGKIATLSSYPHARFVCGIGSPASFRRKPEIVAAAGLPAERWATIVHPAASVSPSAQLGYGCVLLANCAIGANARLGDHVIVLQNSVISHDSVIGACTAIATGVCVSGLVTIGDNCYVGSNASLRERIRLGARVLVGTGAVVLNDVDGDAVMIGNPARRR